MAKRRIHEEHEDHERWLVSYADFITLLFAFFVVLYATSSKNEEKEREFQESIRKYLKLVATAFSPAATGVSESAIPFETLGTTKQKSVDYSLIEKEVRKIIANKLPPGEQKELIPSIKSDPSGVRIVLASTVFFQPNSAKMRPAALKGLSAVAEILKVTPYRVMVEGHTDDQPVLGGRYDTNWELAGAQASAIIRYLQKVYGVSPKKMSAISFADQRPLVENNNDQNRALNRRIEVFIKTDTESEE